LRHEYDSIRVGVGTGGGPLAFALRVAAERLLGLNSSWYSGGSSREEQCQH
jgi:hypothetical protein